MLLSAVVRTALLVQFTEDSWVIPARGTTCKTLSRADIPFGDLSAGGVLQGACCPDPLAENVEHSCAPVHLGVRSRFFMRGSAIAAVNGFRFLPTAGARGRVSGWLL